MSALAHLADFKSDISGGPRSAKTGHVESQAALRETTYPCSDGGEENAQGVLGSLWILCDAHNNELDCSEQSHQEEDKNNRNHHNHPRTQQCENKGCKEKWPKPTNKSSDWSFEEETRVGRFKGEESSNRRY